MYEASVMQIGYNDVLQLTASITLCPSEGPGVGWCSQKVHQHSGGVCCHGNHRLLKWHYLRTASFIKQEITQVSIRDQSMP